VNLVFAETHEIWLLYYLKITEKFQAKGENMLFLSLTEDNLPNYTQLANVQMI
jgi:hypothetical protein